KYKTDTPRYAARSRSSGENTTAGYPSRQDTASLTAFHTQPSIPFPRPVTWSQKTAPKPLSPQSAISSTNWLKNKLRGALAAYTPAIEFEPCQRLAAYGSSGS